MLNELFGLDGQVAVVTGAGRGIGEGIARTLAGAGATVVCAARRTHEIKKVASERIGSITCLSGRSQKYGWRCFRCLDGARAAVGLLPRQTPTS